MSAILSAFSCSVDFRHHKLLLASGISALPICSSVSGTHNCARLLIVPAPVLKAAIKSTQVKSPGNNLHVLMNSTKVQNPRRYSGAHSA